MNPRKNDIVVLTDECFNDIGDIGIVIEYIKAVNLWAIELGDDNICYGFEYPGEFEIIDHQEGLL